MKGLSTLNGVGPATASLIMSVAFPSDMPYFSDELYFWCVKFSGISQRDFTGQLHQRFEDVVIHKKMPKISLKYTVKEYEVLWDKVQETRLIAQSDRSQHIHEVSATDIEKAAFVIMRADEASTALDWSHAKPDGLYEDFVRDHLNGEQAALEKPKTKRRRAPTTDNQNEDGELHSRAPKRAAARPPTTGIETSYKSPVYAPRRTPLKKKITKSVTPKQPLTCR